MKTASLALALTLAAHAWPGYLVTASPIDVGRGTRGLCVAVNLDAHGVWWWEPAPTGCAGRASGPGVFHAESALVERSPGSSAATVRFRLPTTSASRPFLDVQLIVNADEMRTADGRARVPVTRRHDLDIPAVSTALQ